MIIELLYILQLILPSINGLSILKWIITLLRSDKVKEKIITLEYTTSATQFVDIATKALTGVHRQCLKFKICLVDAPSQPDAECTILFKWLFDEISQRYLSCTY